jgi:hypothetical protein
MNKNSKYRKSLAHKAMNHKQATFSYDGKTYPAAAKPDANGVVSKNAIRNSQMKIYFNFGQTKSQNTCITRHEPISKEGGFKSKDKLKTYEKFSKGRGVSKVDSE